jgi:hypothetical protein
MLLAEAVGAAISRKRRFSTERRDECGDGDTPAGQASDLGWLVMAHGELYAAEFGWDISLRRW